MYPIRCLWLTVSLLTAFTLVSKAQLVDTTINLNLLRNPISPAANLLGISPSEIQQPTDVPAFVVSLQNATNGFSSLPANFAISVAPYWLLRNRGRNVSFNQFNSNKGSIPQSLVVSAAIKSQQSRQQTDSTVQVGLGFRFSFLRGKFSNDRVKKLDALLERQRKAFEEGIDGDRSLNELEKQITLLTNKSGKTPEENVSLKALVDQYDSQVRKVTVPLRGTVNDDSLSTELLYRYGAKLDLSAGLAWDFPDARFSQQKLFKSGVWLTGGYESKNGHVFLGILRYLYNPDKVFAEDDKALQTQNVNTFDGGVKYAYQNQSVPLNLSTEFIYRSVLNRDTQVPSSWRWTVNVNYAVAKNLVLTFAFGRDFDKTAKQDGNVIALLNLIKGFGTSRQVR